MSDELMYPLFYSDLFIKPNVGTNKQRKVLLARTMKEIQLAWKLGTKL